MRLFVLLVCVAFASARRDPRCPVYGEETPEFEIGFPFEPPLLMAERNALPVHYLVHESDCTRFYVCNGQGESMESVCPLNHEFNPETLRCETGLDLCSWDKKKKVASRVDDHLCYGHADGQKFATNNCNSFIICENSIGMLQTCDYGLLFNQHEGICDWPENVHCGELVGPPQGAAPNCVGRDGEHLPNPYDCNSFYICEHNAALLYHCDYGLYFDDTIKTCNWKENVQCVIEELPEEQPYAPDCYGYDWVYFPNPSNCGTYFRCEQNSAILYTCPEGLLFDKNLSTCNWAPSVNCN